MRNHKITIAVAVTAIVVCIAIFVFWARPDPVKVAAGSVPVVMHTNGGRLEVATVTVVDSFKLDDPKEFVGIDLGTTFSHVNVPAKYRYYIDMNKEWPINLNGKTALVEAGEIKLQLPVAFDTATMERYTASGWARFNKHENLDRLMGTVSPMLAARGAAYKKLTTAAARKTVTDFVTTWLVKYHPLKDGTVPHVEVVFPGETPTTPKSGI